MKGIHRKGLKMNEIELKTVQLTLDENQICVLDSIMNTIRHDYASVWGSRDDYEVLRQYIKTKVMEVI
jgi:hypothetical protein